MKKQSKPLASVTVSYRQHNFTMLMPLKKMALDARKAKNNIEALHNKSLFNAPGDSTNP